MSRHRQAQLEMLLSPDFAQLVKQKKVRLITYAGLIQRHGLSAMRRPQ